MAVYTNAGGGGGASSDELTAARGDVLKGKTAVPSDSSDEPVEGTLELTGDAADSHVLIGKTYYNKDPKTRRAGTMPNRGAVAQELAAGGSYTVPEGYHNGGGKVTAKSLASQTGGATAADGDVLSGKTYWKDGAKRTGTMTNQGAKTAALNAGGSYAIPAGYHNGSGRVTANSLASQTSANAAAGHILSGKTAWVNGSKLTGNIASMGGQTITPTASQQTVSCSGKYMTGNIVVKGIPSNYVPIGGWTAFLNGASTGSSLGLAPIEYFFHSSSLTGLDAWNYVERDSRTSPGSLTMNYFGHMLNKWIPKDRLASIVLTLGKTGTEFKADRLYFVPVLNTKEHVAFGGDHTYQWDWCGATGVGFMLDRNFSASTYTMTMDFSRMPSNKATAYNIFLKGPPAFKVNSLVINLK